MVWALQLLSLIHSQRDPFLSDDLYLIRVARVGKDSPGEKGSSTYNCSVYVTMTTFTIIILIRPAPLII